MREIIIFWNDSCGHIRDLADGFTSVCLDTEFEVHHEIPAVSPIADEILLDPYRRVRPTGFAPV
jgi:hypothetical protein